MEKTISHLIPQFSNEQTMTKSIPINAQLDKMQRHLSTDIMC